MRALELMEVRRSYETGREALRGVTLSVASGEVVGLLGTNGAGKTTLLRIAMGMLHTHGGTVRVLGADPWHEPVELKRRIGYVAEEQILPPDLRVGEVLSLHRQIFTTWDAALENRLFERFAIPPSARIGKLSKGQARQVALVCAVAHRPELLLLDEPAGGLDPAARRGILEAAIGLLSDAGSTVLFSSHHMADVERIAGRVVLLHEGRVRLDGELDKVREGYSLAVIPLDAIPDPGSLAVDGLVRSRRTPFGWHAVFSRPPEELESLLTSRLGMGHAVCRPVPLEDLFVEMVEGDS